MRALKFKNCRKRDLQGYLWILPAFLLLAVFSYYPPVAAFYYSLTNWNGVTATFKGFGNFVRLFKDSTFYFSLRNMVIMLVIGLIAGNVMTIIFAEMLFNLRGKKLGGFFRFMFILPILVPGIVSMLMWTKIIFSPSTSGFMNTVLGLLGIKSSAWYYAPKTAMLSLILTGFPWVAGTSFLIYLAGFQNIPISVYEAAELDGIGLMKRIFLIDLPLILSQIKYFVILGIIGGVQNFAMQFAVIKPAPDSPAMVPGYYMYISAFNYSQFGYACTIGLVLFVLILIVTIINNKFLKTTEAFA